MKIKAKHPITLIELLIAMALTSLALTTLLYFYRDIDWLNQDMNKSQQEAFKITYVQNRLSDVLPHAISPRTTDKDFFFFTSGESSGLLKPSIPSLIFTYHFGPNLDPFFANHVLGRLYVDTHDRLCLATLPSPKFWTPTANLKIRNEILLENVESLSFNFYVPPEKDRSLVGNRAPQKSSQKNKIDIQPKDSWSHIEWKNEYQQLPAMIKLTLKIKNKTGPVIFIFPLPMSEFTIVYP